MDVVGNAMMTCETMIQSLVLLSAEATGGSTAASAGDVAGMVDAEVDG